MSSMPKEASPGLEPVAEQRIWRIGVRGSREALPEIDTCPCTERYRTTKYEALRQTDYIHVAKGRRKLLKIVGIAGKCSSSLLDQTSHDGYINNELAAAVGG